MTGDILDPSALLETVQSLLRADSGVRLRDGQDALALLVHAIMVQLDFRPRELPQDWAETHTFRYRHDQSSLAYILKLVSMGPRLLIHATAEEGNKTSTLEIKLDQWTSTSFWPYPQPQPQPQPEPQPEPLVNGFIGSSRIRDFVALFKRDILNSLIPGLVKEGYEPPPERERYTPRYPDGQGQGQDGRGGPSRQPYPDPDVFAPPPPRHPFAIGDRDLDPLAGSPLRMPPRFGGGGGPFAPPPVFPGGGGMYPTPDHPLFGPRAPPGERLPPGAVPPGARFDPILPFNGPGPGPRGPDVGGARPQPRPRRDPRSGDPDWDDLPPPGNNDYDNMFM